MTLLLSMVDYGIFINLFTSSFFVYIVCDKH